MIACCMACCVHTGTELALELKAWYKKNVKQKRAKQEKQSLHPQDSNMHAGHQMSGWGHTSSPPVRIDFLPYT